MTIFLSLQKFSIRSDIVSFHCFLFLLLLLIFLRDSVALPARQLHQFFFFFGKPISEERYLNLISLWEGSCSYSWSVELKKSLIIWFLIPMTAYVSQTRVEVQGQLQLLEAGCELKKKKKEIEVFRRALRSFCILSKA